MSLVWKSNGRIKLMIKKIKTKKIFISKEHNMFYIIPNIDPEVLKKINEIIEEVNKLKKKGGKK
jgi:hypothetical protein